MVLIHHIELLVALNNELPLVFGLLDVDLTPGEELDEKEGQLFSGL